MTELLHALPDWIVAGAEIAGFACSVIGGVAGIGAWVARNALVTTAILNTRFEEHDRKHAALEQRIGLVEQEGAVVKAELKHLPRAEDIKQLTDRVAGIEKTIGSFGAQLDGLREVLERVERPLNVLIDHQLKRDDR